jgi:glycosyltransferase involved in cell wall biosynthesis
MKILHISTGYPLSYPGGITNYVRALATSQVARGEEVYVLARPEDASNYPEGVIVKGYMPSKVSPFSVRIVEEDPSTAEILDIIRNGRFSIVHFHMALDLPLHFLRDFSTLGVPYVVSLHDYFYICGRFFLVDVASDICREVDLQKCKTCVGALDQIRILSGLSRRLKFQLPRVPSSTAEIRFAAMSKFLKGARLLLPVSTRTAEIYRNAVPDAQFEVALIGNASADLPPARKIPSKTIRVTAIGTLNKMKGAGVLEELLQRVRRSDVEFHFYGWMDTMLVCGSWV